MDSGETKGPWWRRLHWQILIALLLGVGIGAIGYSANWAEGLDGGRSVFWYLGNVWLRLLKMIVLPLIVTSIVVGVSSLDPERLGRVGLKTFLYYLTTTAIAVVIGLVMVNAIRPGVGAELGAARAPSVQPDGIGDILMGIIPTNVFESLVGGYVLRGDGSLGTVPPAIISVIFFFILFGLAITKTGEPARPVRSFFVGANEAVMTMTMWVMALAPIGVFGLIADIVLNTGFDSFGALAAYMATVQLGLALHAVVILPLLLWVLGRRKAHEFARDMSPALLTAFSTSSSSATLPLTITSAQERGRIPRSISEFVLPLGATVNMDGTALYEAVAVLFIAQAYGIDLSLGQQVVVALTATMAAIGAAGVPSAGTVMMILVLQAVGLPLEGIGLILAVDRILDMCRTTVNVWGDSVGAAIIARFEPDPDAVPETPFAPS